jgi:hypothetical protein
MENLLPMLVFGFIVVFTIGIGVILFYNNGVKDSEQKDTEEE